MKSIYRLLMMLSLTLAFVGCEKSAGEGEGTGNGNGNGNGAGSTETPEYEVADDLVLTPSVGGAVASDNCRVDFTLFDGYIDISSKATAKLYLKTDDGVQEQKNLSYKLSEAGDYEFFATYEKDGKTIGSNTVSVKGLEEWNSTPFYKRTLGIQSTGSWCGNCPMVTVGLRHYYEEGNDELVTVASHGGDMMQTATSTTLHTQLQINSIPDLSIGSLFANYVSVAGAYNTVDITLFQIKKSVAAALGTSNAKTGIAVKTDLANGVISFESDIYVGEKSQLGVGAMLIVDGIEDPQTSYFNNGIELDVWDNSLDSHENVVLASVPKASPLHDDLGGVKEQGAKTMYKFNSEFNTASISLYKHAKASRIVIYVYDKVTHKIDNVVAVPVGKSIEVQYEK